MKRLLALAFASVMLVALAVPAMAGVDFGGQYRARGEWRENVFLEEDSDTNEDQAFIGQRVRLWGVATPTDDVTVKVTIQDSRNWGAAQHASINGPNLTDRDNDNTLDLHESWLQITDFLGQPLTLKIGRQELSYGDERLIGSFGWNNNGRSFDAVKATHSNDNFDVDLFYAKIDEGLTGSVNNNPLPSATVGSNGTDQDFWGVYATLKTIPNNTLDAYVLLLKDLSGTQFILNGDGAIDVVGMIGSQELYTYGLRLKGNTAFGLDYTAEYAAQTGEIAAQTPGVSDADIDGDAYALMLGYAIPNNNISARVGGQYVFASGDSDPADGDIETFSNLFPTNHGHLGYADLQGWRNVTAWNLNASVKPLPKWFVKLDYWNFTLDEEDDRWYNAGNWMNTIGSYPACPACDDDLGSEIDLTVKYKYNSAVDFMAGYSIFSPGGWVEDQTTIEEDQSFAYLQITGNF